MSYFNIPQSNPNNITTHPTNYHIFNITHGANKAHDRSVELVTCRPDSGRKPRTPQEEVESVEVPDVELVVEGATEAHAHKVTSEQGQYDVWIDVD